jgi:adenosylhomocysteine nucleosidase
MPVAFVCAMPMELAPLKRRLQLEKTRDGPLDIYRGAIGTQPVVAIVTGMGTSLSAEKLARLLEAVEVKRVVVVGITGAVDADAEIGSLVLPALVVDGRTGDEYRPHPLGGGRAEGKMWTTDTLITDLDVVAGLREVGVVSMDMETAAIAEVCERRGIPWSVFRTVSDRVTDGLLDEEVFRLSKPDGSPNLKAVITYVVRHPGRLPAMARIMKEAKLATERAADAAIAAVSAS